MLYTPFIRLFLKVVIVGCFSVHALIAEEEKVASKLSETASAFIEGLEKSQSELLVQAFSDTDRTRWHYVPRKRAGLSLADLSSGQREALWVFLENALSEQGMEKVKGVIAAERVLWEQTNQSDFRDPDKYYVSFYGEPGTEKTWFARFEGHHLSINLTVVDGKDVFVTPSFFGSNPDRLPDGSRPLAGEYERAKALAEMLTTEQRALAMRKGRGPREIITRARARVEPGDTEGLPASKMSDEQMDALMLLISEYLERYRSELAEDDLMKIEGAGLENIYFLWAGAFESGSPVYYRIQGPTFIMEYANTQNEANHSHTVWRDFENDFGYDALLDHLEKHH
ncbi:MAG: DUF3500 domain-containing protein [Opitutales bacterium]